MFRAGRNLHSASEPPRPIRADLTDRAEANRYCNP